MKLKLETKKDGFDITLNLSDAFLEDGKVFLDPIVMQKGLYNALKKARIIRNVTGVTTYNYIDIPIAKINIGKLKEYDKYGVLRYIEYKEGQT